MSEMVERAAQAIMGPHLPIPAGEQYTLEQLRAFRWKAATDAERHIALNEARAAIEAFNDPDDAFIYALSERMHDARFSKSGEGYPIARNFIRSFVDAALNGEAK